MNVVPCMDLKAGNLEIATDLNSAYQAVFNSGWYILGQELASFEAEFAEYCDAKFCIGVGNGLDALHLILKAMDIGPGDEVIVPTNTFIATWFAVSLTGATPVPLDPDMHTHNIKAKDAEKLINERTKAIIVVHLYGQSCEMDEFRALSQQFNLKLIEDAAQAHGSTYRGKKVGSLGDAAGFSFYPGKNLGALGDGGAITTNSEVLAEKLRSMRSYGSVKKYHHDIAGGDISFMEKARARMHSMIDKANIMVMVSHDHHLISSLCNRVIWLDHGKLIADGSPDEVVNQYLNAMTKMQ